MPSRPHWQNLWRRRSSQIADSCGCNLDRDMYRGRQAITADIADAPELSVGIDER